MSQSADAPRLLPSCPDPGDVSLPNPTTAVLIVGYGCTLRTDDGIGQAVALAVRDSCIPEAIEVRPVTQLLPELSFDLAAVHAALFVDADRNIPELTWKLERVQPMPPPVLGLDCCFSPPELLGVTQLLFGRAPGAMLLRVGARRFDYHHDLSPPMQALLPELAMVAEDAVAALASLVSRDQVGYSSVKDRR